MPTIDEENKKAIRTPFEVHCGMSGRDTKVDLTFSDITGAVTDTNPSEALDNEHWDMRNLTDLSGGGFPLDGSCSLYDASIPGSNEEGKMGLRSKLGETVSVTVKAKTVIAALTVAVTSDSSGTISANGADYTAGRITVIPVNGKEVTLTAESQDEGSRIEIASITPGITLEFNNKNLISCTLALRSDLSIISPSWQVSEIEIQAYWPDDISEAISNVGDDVPVWYYAGYEGDYSKTRSFYLSEKASMENNVITIKGEDMSAKLEDKNNISQVLNSTGGNGRKTLYNRFVKFITDSGVKLVSRETAPDTNSNSSPYTLIFDEQSSREIVADIMNLSHNGSFWPSFVDAGIPKVTWSKPSKKWDIYEKDCGDVVRSVERNIAKITTDADYGLLSKAVRSQKLEELETKSVKAGEGYSHSPDGYWWYLTVSNAKSVLATANRIVWTAKKSTVAKKVKEKTGKRYKTGKKKGQPIYRTVTKKINQCVVKGKEVTLTREASSLIHSGKRPGSTATVDPIAHGKVYGGTTLLYPAYEYLFNRSNITGSFTFKGDPRMQPRDVFSFHRLDGSLETCTIETITLTHESGGTKAEVTYRKGIC
jgi:hypothetical protein